MLVFNTSNLPKINSFYSFSDVLPASLPAVGESYRQGHSDSSRLLMDDSSTLAVQVLDLAPRKGRGSGNGNELKLRFCTARVRDGIKPNGAMT